MTQTFNKRSSNIFSNNTNIMVINNSLYYLLFLSFNTVILNGFCVKAVKKIKKNIKNKKNKSYYLIKSSL